MTAPTIDERREVAERLRDEAGGFRRLEKEWGHEPTIDLGDVPAAFQDVAHFAGLDGAVRTCVLLDRLADLIDPCPSMADEQMGKLRRRSTALASMTRIASDMSGWAGELADSCKRMSRARIADDVERFADRIRQEVRDALN